MSECSKANVGVHPDCMTSPEVSNVFYGGSTT